jgi:AcrR family transcriptional regulator
LTKERPFVFSHTMSKGERTRSAILDQALALTSKQGLAGLTIGTLAENLRMSKSGLFAHFGSKEQLQQAVLERAEELFAETVVRPAMAQPRGLPRLIAVFENWLAWTQRADLPGGCPFQVAGIELDDQPGPLRDTVAASQDQLRTILARAASKSVEEGHLRADLDIDQFVFGLTGIYFAYNHMNRLLRLPQAQTWARVAFNELLDRARRPAH